MSCYICYTDFDKSVKQNTIKLACEHEFHVDCIEKEFEQQHKYFDWYFDTFVCPYCRTKTQHSEYEFINSNNYQIFDTYILNTKHNYEKYNKFDKNKCCVLTGSDTQCQKKIKSESKEMNICEYHKRNIHKIKNIRMICPYKNWILYPIT